MKKLLGIHSSENIPNLTNHEIKENKIKCKKFTRQLWNDMSKTSVIETTTYSSEFVEKLTMNLEVAYLDFAKNI